MVIVIPADDEEAQIEEPRAAEREPQQEDDWYRFIPQLQLICASPVPA